MIDDAGGQAQFARRVWGDSGPYKGLVGRWYNGRTGISVAKADKVAKKTGWRAAWILSGELPERVGAVRDEATLEVDFKVYVRRAVADKWGMEPEDVVVSRTALRDLVDLFMMPRLVAVRPAALRRLGPGGNP
jgi:hypothetical protein